MSSHTGLFLVESAHCIMNIVTEYGVIQGYVPFSAVSFPIVCG